MQLFILTRRDSLFHLHISFSTSYCLQLKFPHFTLNVMTLRAWPSHRPCPIFDLPLLFCYRSRLVRHTGPVPSEGMSGPRPQYGLSIGRLGRIAGTKIKPTRVSLLGLLAVLEPSCVSPHPTFQSNPIQCEPYHFPEKDPLARANAPTSFSWFSKIRPSCSAIYGISD